MYSGLEAMQKSAHTEASAVGNNDCTNWIFGLTLFAGFPILASTFICYQKVKDENLHTETYKYHITIVRLKRFGFVDMYPAVIAVSVLLIAKNQETM